MSDDEQLVADTQTRAAITALLNKEGNLTLTEICTALSLSVEGTRPLVRQMVDDKLIFMTKDGTRKEYGTKAEPPRRKTPKRKAPKVHASTGEVELVIGGGMIVVPSDRMIIVTTNPATGRTQIIIEERA